MGELTDFQVGQTVELQDGRKAMVKFVGNTLFATGDWLGVELESATGKNDGAVQGQRYFQCELNHGMFVRPTVVTVLDQPTPKQKGTSHAQGRLNGMAPSGRYQSMAMSPMRRPSVLDSGVAKRQSINAGSPTPGARATAASRFGSPSRSPTKQSGPTSLGNTTKDATPTALRNLPKGNRPSMPPPSTFSNNVRQSRQLISTTLNGSVRGSNQSPLALSRAAGAQPSIHPSSMNKLNPVSRESQASIGSGRVSPVESTESEAPSTLNIENRNEQARVPASSSSQTSTLHRVVSSEKPSSLRGKSPPSSTTQRGPTSSAALQREVEDLKTKLRVIEKRRMEDREKLKSLDKMQAERDKFEGIIQKLQLKYQPLQQEILELKRQSKEETAKCSALEQLQAEHENIVEIATLDREMAEETAESLKAELDTLRQRTEELTLENEILRDENQELGKEMSPEERATQGWLQMEKSNQRLREALIKLRDMTQQKEGDLKAQIAELEKDLCGFQNAKESNFQTKGELEKANIVNEDLRQQLDNALGAEEMIEELAEKNLSLKEQVDVLRTAVEDLENLKELNDELELNHTETEKQMQIEIDYNESLLAEQARKNALQDENIRDLEYTVTQFRSLVRDMQNDLEDLKASKQITESEASEIASRSKAMTDLNTQLQISASKAQVKAIDLELRKLDAQQLAEHIEIVQVFLPELLRNEGNSVLAFLSLKRVASKASIMQVFLREYIHSPVLPGHERDIFSCCDILDKLAWISSASGRFIKFIENASLEEFTRLEGVAYELEPVERAFNGWIDELRRDELREEKCAVDLQRSIALMTHLIELHVPDGLGQYADEIQAKALVMQSHLENTTIALSHIKSISQSRVDPISEKSQVDGEQHDLLRKVDHLIMQTRSAKVILGKAIHQLEDLKTRALTLDQSMHPNIELFYQSTFDLVLSTRKVGISILQVVNEEGRSAPFTYEEIYMAASSDATPFSSLLSKVNSVITQMQKFYNMSSSLNNVVEFPSPAPKTPWSLLAENMRAESNTSAIRESEVSKLKAEMAEKNTALAIRDKRIEELGVKIEVLEKRVGDSSGQREKVREFESIIDKMRSKEKNLQDHIAMLQNVLRDLESERETWNRSIQSPDLASKPGQSAETPAVPHSASSRQIDGLKAEILSLQSVVRHQRSINHSRQVEEDLKWLSVPLTPPPKPLYTPLQQEARDLIKELRTMVLRPENMPVRPDWTNRQDIFKWKPARETMAWKVARQREQWEQWVEWRHDLFGRIRFEKRHEVRKQHAQAVRALKAQGREDLLPQLNERFKAQMEEVEAKLMGKTPREPEEAEEKPESSKN